MTNGTEYLDALAAHSAQLQTMYEAECTAHGRPFDRRITTTLEMTRALLYDRYDQINSGAESKQGEE
jgi:hypothetical protein